MQLQHPATLDPRLIECPRCSGRRGLEPVLRLEMEAESAVMLVTCTHCGRFYCLRHQDEGRHQCQLLDEVEIIKVQCPGCGAVGHALRYRVQPDEAESVAVMTCQECHHTFRNDPPSGQ